MLSVYPFQHCGLSDNANITKETPAKLQLDDPFCLLKTNGPFGWRYVHGEIDKPRKRQ